MNIFQYNSISWYSRINHNWRHLIHKIHFWKSLSLKTWQHFIYIFALGPGTWNHISCMMFGIVRAELWEKMLKMMSTWSEKLEMYRNFNNRVFTLKVSHGRGELMLNILLNDTQGSAFTMIMIQLYQNCQVCWSGLHIDIAVKVFFSKITI